MKKAKIFDSAYAGYYKETQVAIYENMDLYKWDTHVIRMQHYIGCICTELGILSILSVMNGLCAGNPIYMIILGVLCIVVGIYTCAKKSKDELLESLLLDTYDEPGEDD